MSPEWAKHSSECLNHKTPHTMEKVTFEFHPYEDDSWDCMISIYRANELVVQYQFMAQLTDGIIQFELDPECHYNPPQQYLSFITSTLLNR
jgi:hypothetical protein